MGIRLRVRTGDVGSVWVYEGGGRGGADIGVRCVEGGGGFGWFMSVGSSPP